MDTETFESIVVEALDSLPPEFARYLENVEIQIERRKRCVVHSRRRRMHHRRPDNAGDRRVAGEFTNSINVAQVVAGWLAGSAFATLSERPVGQEASARRPEHPRHYAGFSHRQRDQFSLFAVSAIEKL